MEQRPFDPSQLFSPFDPFGIERPRRRVLKIGGRSFTWPLRWALSGYILFALWLSAILIAFAIALKADAATVPDPYFSPALDTHQSKLSYLFGGPVMGVLCLVIATLRACEPGLWIFRLQENKRASSFMKSEVFIAVFYSFIFVAIPFLTQMQSLRAIRHAALPV